MRAFLYLFATLIFGLPAQKLRDFDLSDAAVKAKMRERYGGRVPLDEPVISPAAMFDSTLLETIVRED